ncbi:hypothetical protein FN846DRAFT_887410 [Sphaerosporella brunnea]|uniref:Uncharacterized protein n=1 Tax=Sphaerosporella brunnea TaxID=1250544 RepID=A0A5J5F6N2_9PEZI|nr:hypothetical protein FN846DRAFT_887410 [Sphaerosporella brunnea]
MTAVLVECSSIPAKSLTYSRADKSHLGRVYIRRNYHVESPNISTTELATCPNERKRTSPRRRPAARLTAFIDRPQPPRTSAREVVAIDELMDMRMWPRQEGEAGPLPLLMPSIEPLWDTHDGHHAVWDRADDGHQPTTETANEDDGKQATQPMRDDDEGRIDLAADGEENETNIMPGVMHGGSQATTDHSRHGATEGLDDDEIASPPPLSPGIIENLCAISLCHS